MTTLQFPLYQRDLCADLKKTFLKRASDTDSTRSGESVIDEVTQNLSTDIAVYAEKLIKTYTSEGGTILANNVDFEGAEDGAVLTYDGANKKWVGKLGSGYVTRQEWEDFVSGTDADNVINKWSEVEKFLMGMKETDNLNKLLKDKMSVKTFLKLFTPMDKDGNELDFTDEEAEVASIRANYGFWSVDFVSALGKSTGGESGGEGGDTPAGSSGALYDLVDVLANESGDGVKGAVTGSVLIFNGTHWEAGDPPASKDAYTKEEIDKLIESVKFFERVNIGTETSPKYAIHVLNSLGFYSDDFISALGKSYGGGGSGSGEIGEFYDRLDAWEDYDDSTKEWVLSAFLGYDLYTRIGELDKRLTVVEKKDTYTKEEIDAMILFEKRNIGTEAEPIYAIHAKYGYGVYSDDFISALGVAPDSIGSGGTSYDRLDDWGDYTDDKAEWVLSALLGENLNERLLALELGNKGHLIDIVGGGNVVTDVYENSGKTTLTFVKGNVSWSTIVEKPTTLEGFGITDGVNDFEITGVGNAFTDVSIMGHIISLNKGETFLPKSVFDELFEKVNIGTSAAPEYAIRAKYGFYSDSFVSAKGYGDSSSSDYDRLDSWDDYTSTRGSWVLSAYLGNDLNERVTALEDGTAGKSGHTINIVGTGGVVTEVEELGNVLTFYKGAIEWSNGITGFPKNLTDFGINNVGSTSLPIYMNLGVPTEVVASELFSSLVVEGDNISMTIAGQKRDVAVGYATTAGTWKTARNFTITDGVNVGNPTSVNGSADVSLNLPQNIKANTFSVDGLVISKSSDGVLKIDANLIVTGGITMYALDGALGGNFATLLGGYIDNNTIKQDEEGKLYVDPDFVGGGTVKGATVGGNAIALDSATGILQFPDYLPKEGNAASATKLQTARSLWGNSFDGTADVSGSLRILATGFSYNQGIRIHPASDDWCGVVLCGSTNTGETGTSVGTWSMWNHGNGNFRIGRGAVEDNTKSLVWGDYLTINNTDHRINVNAWPENSDVGALSVNITKTTDGKWTRAVQICHPNVKTNENTIIAIGKEGSRGNIAYFGFGYVASGSASNFITLGFQGYDDLLTILRNGNVGIGTTAPSHKLHVVGDVFSTTGFQKSGSSDSYALLGGGGHTLLSSLSVGNADMVDNYHASAFAFQGAHNNLIAASNEFTFASAGYSGNIFINYRTASGATDGNITSYILCNGGGSNLGIILHTGNYNSYSPTLTGGGASGTWGINITGTASGLSGGSIPGWGTLTAANGYTNVATYDYGSALGAFSWAGKGGQMSMQLDGFFYQNEGKYMCLDANNYKSYALPLTGGTMTGVITSTFASNTWINGVTNACLTANYSGYGAIFSAPTKDGRVCMSTHPAGGNNLYFGYATSSQISSGTNAFTTRMYWDAPHSRLVTGTFEAETKVTVGAINITNSSSGVLKIDGNLVVTGGVTMYATDGTSSSSLSYLPLTGGTLNGNLYISGSNKIHFDSATWMYADSNGYFHISPSEGIKIDNDMGLNGWSISSVGSFSCSTCSATTVRATTIKNKNSSDAYILLGGGGTKAVSDFATASHTHNYLSTSGGSLSGSLSVSGSVTASSGFVKSGYGDSYVLLAGGGVKAVSDFGSGSSGSYLPLSGGTLTGTLTMSNAMIVTPGNDSYGIRPASHNYGTVGTSNYYYYRTYSTYYYGSYVSLSGGSITTGGGDIRTGGGDVFVNDGMLQCSAGSIRKSTLSASDGMMIFNLNEGAWFDNDVYFETGYSDLSDIRKKDIFENVLLPLEEIANSPIIRFAYKSDAKKRTHIGTAAQYWLCEGDWFVNETADGYYTLESANLALAVGLSLGQHLLEFKTTTEKRIEALENENKELRERIAALEAA